MAGLDAAWVIRTGTATLLLALGILFAVVARAKPRSMALGLAIACFASATLFANVNMLVVVPHGALVSFAVDAAGIAALAIWAAPLARQALGGGARLGGALVAAALAAVAMLAEIARLPASELLPEAGSTMLEVRLATMATAVEFVGFLVVAALAGRAAERAEDPLQRRRLVLVGLAFSCWPAVWGAIVLLPPITTPVLFAAYGSATALVVAAWLFACERGAGKPAARVAWWAAAWTLVGLFAATRVDAAGVDPVGFPGLARGAMFACLAYATFRLDLLGVPLPRLAVRRGPVAAAALATLFVVAQLAQNVFEARYGLVLGGVVAGTFLFAAAPLQRAIERLLAPSAAAPAPEAAAPARAEEAYRAAVRAALEDGAMTAREEEHLADVAHHVGLGPREALRLRREVERELGHVR